MLFRSLFTAASLRRDARSRRASDLLMLLEQHRELWSELHRRPELARILAPEADLVAQPPTVPESEYLNLVFVHFHTGWLLAAAGAAHDLEILADDIRGFFTLPLPRAAWHASRATRDPGFVRFVDGCLADRKRRRRG